MAVEAVSSPDGSIAFSVIVTLFNKEAYVRPTVESVLAQDHPHYEVIIVDDGSTDNSVAAVQGLVGGRVRLIQQLNQGPGPARNHGAKEAAFEWIAFLDGDDLWRPNHLSTLAQLIDAFPEADAAATGFRRAARAEDQAKHSAETALDPFLLDYFRAALDCEPICSSSVALRRETLFMLGGFGAFWPGEDLDLWVRLALDHRIAATKRETAVYRVGTGGLMDSWQERPPEDFKPQPVFATLDAAIEDPRHATLRDRICTFHDHLLQNGAKQALYRGEGRVARQYLARMRVPRLPPLLKLLSIMPRPLASAGARTYSLLKRSFLRPGR
jgi:glycosyltransferase involved in cell wall biosynthesis